MRLVIQKVSQACVTSTLESTTTTASINKGLLALVNFETGDTLADLEAATKSVLKLRVFESEEKRYDRNIVQVEEELLLVSQFTLNATLKSGRPSFHRALNADSAKEYYSELIRMMRESGVDVQHGVFGSWMQVHLVNEGPFTICLQAHNGKCETW